ncbi:hypothetical protein GGS23DRAFT_410900 [Durotheca rogersii]|uniref:uncharacterized protein n=1 Tax=Durotheca rogersii TaxID=419775 RepID=UPI00221EA0C5|nr:uncharacterized protein GGS23DRAFT_410900 [Durotheca rogersii]KAI5865131.1 hypothetical protein GGS23DRAFT_410900 [Durotheca rogersii]
MDQSVQRSVSKGHGRTGSGVRTSRPRSSTKGPLDADETPVPSPTPSQAARFGAIHPQPSSRASTPLGRLSSPAPAPRSPALSTRGAPLTSRDFSFLMRPEIFHQLSPLTVPAPFRSGLPGLAQPTPDTPIPELLRGGHFRAAAIAAAQALTSPTADPTDHATVLELLYVRLACLCLIDAAPLAAHESKALEDLNSAFYLDPLTGAHLVPWELRILGVRLQAIGFGDPRRAVMSYYDLARDARAHIARAAASKEKDRHATAALWRWRLADLGVRVAGALIEMDDLAGAVEHLATLGGNGGGEGSDARLAMSRALLWLHLGDVEAARQAVAEGKGGETSESIVDALADMADGEYGTALDKWRALKDAMEKDGVHDEMVGVNTAVCLLYTGNMGQARECLESLVDAGQLSHTTLFNLATTYELCTDRHKNLKTQLAERVAAREPTPLGWEKTNADFKL